MREYVSRLRKLCYYTNAEWIGLVVTSLVAGFAFSFNLWGYVEFELWIGLGNLLRYSIYSFLPLFVMDIGRKLYAARLGYRAEFKVWISGLLLALIASFVSSGGVYLLFLSGFHLKRNQDLQFGRFNREFQTFDLAKIAFAGFLAIFTVNIFISLFAESMPHFQVVLWISFLVVLFTLIPADIIFRFIEGGIRSEFETPLTTGTTILIGSKVLGVFTLFLFVLGYISILLVGLLWFFIIVFLLALFGTATYMFRYEL